ncbi:MAG: PaaI family thioesterase, partial [Brachymonas sp.]
MTSQELSPDAVLAQWQAEHTQFQTRLQAGAYPVGVATPEQVRGKTGLQMMQAMLAGDLPRASIGETMDFYFVGVSFGQAILQAAPHPRCLNPMGGMHGGWYCTLLDSALGCAVHT